MSRMSWRSTAVVVIAGMSLVVGAVGASARMGRGGMGGGPSFQGGWHPKVGTGAVYTIEQKGQPATSWEIAVVGAEGDGHWLEMSMHTDEGPAVTKTLVSPSGATRMIMKMGNEPAMEMPMMAGKHQAVQSDLEKTGKLLGNESVTTPAGTFQCEHYQTTADGKVADAWVTREVSPYGLVKWTSTDSTITLQRVLTGVKSKITETPQSLQLPPEVAAMMQKMQGGGQGGMPQMPAGASKESDHN